MVKTLSALGVLASLVLIVSFSFEAFSNSAFTRDTIYAKIQFGVCIYFLLDFFLLLTISRNRLRFFFRNCILIILSIPYSYLIDYFSIDFSNEALYVIRFLPLVRGGAALAILVKMIVSNRVSGLFMTYLAIFFSAIYFETLIFYVFEAGVNSQLKSYSDTLWWAAMTVTTLGSNIIPVTAIGKVCTATLAVVGISAFPILTAYITSVIHAMNEREKQRLQTGQQTEHQAEQKAMQQAVVSAAP